MRSRRIKIEAWYHLTANISYPLMIVLSTLLLPAMIIRFYQGWFQMLYIDMPLFLASTFSVSSFYLVSQKELYPRTWLPHFHVSTLPDGVGNWADHHEYQGGTGSADRKADSICADAEISCAIKADKALASKYRRTAGLDSVSRISSRKLFRADRLVRGDERKLHHRSLPRVVRSRLLVHGIDVVCLQGRFERFFGRDAREPQTAKPYPVGVIA